MNAAFAKLPRVTFGGMLKIERQKQGLSHRDIAVRCGVDRDTAREWEEDLAAPDRFELKKLFGTVQRLRHYVHLLPGALIDHAREDARAAEDPLPSQLAPVAPPSEPPPTSFREALRRARIREGLDQGDLADLVGVVSQAVSAWETGAASPVLDNFEKLVGLFPELGDFPPDNVRDIDKPAGNRGGSSPHLTHETKDDDMMNSPRLAPPKPMTTNDPRTDQKAALIRWGRLVHALKIAPNAEQLIAFLEEASRAGMTLAEVIHALGDEA